MRNILKRIFIVLIGIFAVCTISACSAETKANQVPKANSNGESSTNFQASAEQPKCCLVPLGKVCKKDENDCCKISAPDWLCPSRR